MKRAGTVVGTAQGVAVVRTESENHPRVGETLVDERLETAGTIVDVFGPVERPYLAVSPPEKHRVATLIGETVYAR